MAVLVFIGLGLAPGDLTLRGRKELRRCERVFIENYTSIMPPVEDPEELTGLYSALYGIHAPVKVLGREEVEEGDVLMESARECDTAFLVVGDCMSATTHVDLLLRARKQGIETRLVHGVSIFTAAPSALGLQHYKFGRTTTLAYPEGEYFPTSPYDAIAENIQRGLHTLVLLDIKADRPDAERRFMTAGEALELLLRMEREKGKGLIGPDLPVCCLARLGAPDQEVRAGSLSGMRRLDMGAPPHCLVIPGRLHFMEEEALELLANAVHNADADPAS